MPTIIGSQQMVEQPSERNWTKEGQLVVTRIFRGPPSRSLVIAKETEMRTLGADRVSSSFGKDAYVRADFTDPIAMDSAQDNTGGSIPAQEQAAIDSSTWELIGNDLSKPLAAHPAFNKSGSQSPQAIAAIDRDVQSHTAAGVNYEATYTAAGKVNTYRDLRIQGTESWLTFSYIIRSTTILPKATTHKIDDLMGSLIPGTVVTYSTIGVPNYARFNQPKYYEFDGTSLVSQLIDEWLVKAPQVRWIGGRRGMLELVREWHGATEWSTVLYKNFAR